MGTNKHLFCMFCWMCLRERLLKRWCRVAGSIEEALAELDMEHYDDEDGGGDGEGGRPFGAGPPGMSYYRWVEVA